MKKLLFLSIAIVYVFCFSKCNGNGSKPDGNDSAKIKSASANTIDTIYPKRLKHLAFFDDSLLNEIKEKASLYDIFLKKFKVVSTDKFAEYNSNFEDIFEIGEENSPIEHLNALPFSIYEKYQGFQFKLNLQSPQFTDLATSKIYKNKIRIYPAIDASKIFYLVLMRETQDVTTPRPVTDRSRYYSIKFKPPYGIVDAMFDEIPNPTPANPSAQMIETERDIRRFQTTWNGLNGPSHPGFVFSKLESFSYFIEDYNELLGNTFPYWDIAGQQTNPFSNVIIRIFPVIDKDISSEVRLRLVLILNRLTTGSYVEIPLKGYFDNMDPCPDDCPSNRIN